MLWTIKRISVFWITIILIAQAKASSDLSSSSLSSNETTESIVEPSTAESNAAETALSVNSFSIQGIKDFIFKGRGVDLARTFSSLRGSISTPFTALMYMGSLAVGAIVMLAFYESPISPLPVPPLPDPPVGRFPPEHPIWPPPSHAMGPVPTSGSGPHHRGSHASSSDHHLIAVRPPLGYIHRRTGMENNGHHGQHHGIKVYKAGQQHQQPTPLINSVKPKIVQKATKLSTGSEEVFHHLVNKVDLKPSNTTLIETNGLGNSTGSSSLASFIKDKPAKLFDILMPRTSENGKQTDQS